MEKFHNVSLGTEIRVINGRMAEHTLLLIISLVDPSFVRKFMIIFLSMLSNINNTVQSTLVNPTHSVPTLGLSD